MRTPLAALLLAGLACPALASERCDVPRAEWRTVEELTNDLTAQGWTVNNIKTEDGCYEVYGHDQTGARVETFFNPATFEAVGSDD
ncbi:PepSY domain-containing protein [Paracoccus sp. Ld10]|uniref:PepSY domain-containing protein n=1 Tax=Paracoccus sp. Ld10 TaxID=649158 RepID=UPI0038701F02